MKWLRQVRVAFDGLDRDGDAMLGQLELSADKAVAAAVRGLGLADEIASEVVAGDGDGDGVIDFAEFIAAVTGRTAQGRAEDERGPGEGEMSKEEYDKVCREQFGEGAEWDGADSCACVEGWVPGDAGCVKEEEVDIDAQCQV